MEAKILEVPVDQILHCNDGNSTMEDRNNVAVETLHTSTDNGNDVCRDTKFTDADHTDIIDENSTLSRFDTSSESNDTEEISVQTPAQNMCLESNVNVNTQPFSKNVDACDNTHKERENGPTILHSLEKEEKGTTAVVVPSKICQQSIEDSRGSEDVSPIASSACIKAPQSLLTLKPIHATKKCERFQVQSTALSSLSHELPPSLQESEKEKDESICAYLADPMEEWNPFRDGAISPGNSFHNLEEDESHNNDKNLAELDSQVSKHALGRTPSSIAELEGLRRIFDSEYERALKDQEILWKARYAATRCSFFLSSICMVLYLWLGCMFYRSEAGWSVPDALLFTVYTVTTVGYGGPLPLPNTAAFHAFTSVYILVGISGVTVLGAHTYQLITLEATRIRASPYKRNKRSNVVRSDQSDESNHDEEDDSGMSRFRRQFMSELEERVKEQPLLDQALGKFFKRIKQIKTYLLTTKSGRILGVILPFLGMILLGAVVVGLIEGWTPLEAIYWSIVTLTTVGYGDYVPTENSSVWFCTLFFIPLSLFFLSFFLAQVATSYIQLHAIHVARFERRMRYKVEHNRAQAQRSEQAKKNAISDGGAIISSVQDFPSPQLSPTAPIGSTVTEKVESGFTAINFSEDEDITSPVRNDVGLFGDGSVVNSESAHNNASISLSSICSTPAMRYREHVLRNKLTAPDPDGKRAISFGEALQSLNHSPISQGHWEGIKANRAVIGQRFDDKDIKPSLKVRMYVQERLARIIAEEVAGFQTGIEVKGSTLSLTISTLKETADKWKIPPQAWKSFRALAFRCLLFVGERDLIADGGDALLRLNAIEFHGIFSPILAAMGDGPSMEEWLSRTEILANAEFGEGRGHLAKINIFSGSLT